MTPCRLLDTRDGDRLGAGKAVGIQVAGRCDVPDDATAVAVTITVVQPDAPGFVVGYPAGTERPTASSVNYQPGEVVANLQLLQLGSGRISIYSLAASDVVVDVSGAFVPAESGRARAGRFVSLEPTRVVDTRETRRPAAGSTVRVRTDVPDDAVVVSDPGTSCPYYNAYSNQKHPGRYYITNRAHGALGYSLSAALGAWYGRPGSKVVGLMGDGSFGFACGELETQAGRLRQLVDSFKI